MPDKPNREAVVDTGRISVAANDPELSRDIPDSFRKAPPVRQHFNESSDPLHKANMEAMGKTETERRIDVGVPEMVRLHKPVPELTPKNDNAQAVRRTSFNNDWIKQHRDAQFAVIECQALEARQRGGNQPSYADIRLPIGPTR